jgi:enterochelin esterase-like enzyme
MVPAAFDSLDALPLTPNGKLDRKALRELERAEAPVRPHVAPRTPVEAAVAAVWAEVLGIERVGVEDDFFGLGGHSLTATRVVAQVRAALAADLPLRAIFRAPTVAALAAEVERARGRGTGSTRCEPELVRSEILDGERYVYVYRPPDLGAGPYPLLVALDGVEYVEELEAPRILDGLVAEGRLPPVVALFVDSVSADLRERELGRNRDFVSFLADELVPWARSHLQAAADPALTTIGGSSDGARGAAFAGLTRPDVFGNVLALSGAFDGLEGDVEAVGGTPPRFYLYAGLLEPEDIVSSTRRLRDALGERDVPLDYRERPAAHTYEAWREPLAEGLLALLGRATSSGRPPPSRVSG